MKVLPEIQLILYQGTLEFAGLAQNTCSYTAELLLYWKLNSHNIWQHTSETWPVEKTITE